MLKRILTYTTIALGLFLSESAFSNDVTGPSPVIVDEVHTYQLDNEFESFYLAPSWEITGGTVQSTWQTGYDYFVSIEWTSTGTGTVTFKNGSIVIDALNVTVNSCPPPTAGSISGDQTICYNGSPVTLNNVTSAGGGDGNIVYKWQYQDVGTSGWTGISSSNSASYTPTHNLTTDRYYRRRARSCDQNRFTQPVLITVLDDLNPGSITDLTQTLCFNEDAPMMTTDALPSGGGGSGYTYQWQSRPVGGSWSNINGATSQAFDPSNLTASTEYRRATMVACQTKYSNIVSANVYPELLPGTIGNAQVVCIANGSPSALTNINSASGGDGTINYQWEKKNSQGQWVEIAGETSATFTPPADAGTNEYQRRVESCGQIKYSNSISVLVYPPLSMFNVNYTGGNRNFGDLIPTIDGEATTGGDGVISYQWERKLSSETEFSPIAGATSEDFDPGYAFESAEYKRITISCETEESNTVSITVNQPVISAPNGTALQVDSELSVPSLSGFGYQWIKDGNALTGETLNTLKVYHPGAYQVNISAPNGQIYSSAPLTLSDEALLQGTNFVKVRVYRKAVDSADELTQIGDATDQYTYYDGLGRQEQLVNVVSSPTYEDVIKPIEYDEFGRIAKDYRPYVEGKGGIRKANALNATYANSDHAADYNNSVYASEGNAFSEVRYESSPLNRPIRQGASGDSWNVDGNNAVTFEYATNEDTDGVRLFDLSTLLSGAVQYYDSSQLYKNSTTDEDGNITLEFSSKEGKTILKKSQVNATDWAETYYIYDNYDQLAVVLSPQATSLLDTDFYGQSVEARKDFLNTWAFLYNYDNRSRMTMKKVPGADSVFMVYDEWDRLVLTQDGVQRQNDHWLFTKYDQLNRPIMTGLMSGGTESQERDAVNDVAGLYDRSESFDVAGTHEYTNTAYPPHSQVDKYLTVTYYDNYNWDNSGLAFTNPTGLTVNNAIKGQVTGTLTSSGDNAFIKSVSYYDEKYRVIQTQSTNHLGGTDIVTNYYDFIGQVTKSISSHNDGTTTTNITRRFEYDHAGRLLNTYHQIDNETEVLIASNSYNDLSELVEKGLHSVAGGTFVQSLDYTYNIRGWLTSINDSDLTSSNDGDLFGLNLIYDQVDSDISNSTYYNGNIGGMKWSVHSDEVETELKERGYRFNYDKLNRLTGTNANRNTTGWGPVSHFRTQYTYDLNGNIDVLRRWGNAATQIDNLDYDYSGSGNQLKEVTDNTADTLGFHDRNTSGDDYEYDANGNMVKDRNKEIDSIHYNHLNLPVKVAFETAGDSITYLYDAAGIKLQQVVYKAGTVVKVTDYVGEFIYETESGGSRSLSLIQHEEGRVIPNESEGSYDYQYHLKDHLGNVRLTFSTTPEEYVIFEDYESTGDSDFQDLHDISLSNRNTTTPYASNDRVDALGSGVTSSMILLSMNKGDTIDLGVNVSYTDAQAGNTFLSIGYNALFNSFDGAFGGVEGVQSTSTDFSDALSSSHMTGKDVESAPRGFLNYIFFDKEMKYVKAGFQQVSTAGHTSGPNTYEVLEINDIIAEQEGYILAYLSNENQEAINIYFDDFKVTHSKTNVVSTQDYYPFGLAFNESVRVASVAQRFKYNQGFGEKTFQGLDGKMFKTERMAEIGLDMTKLRMYDYSLGRFINIDPLANVSPQESWTSYQYAYNNPIRWNDPYGDCAWCKKKWAQAVDYASGVANAVASNNVLGAGRQSGGSSNFQAGQALGDRISLVQGAAEIALGAVITAGGAGVTVGTAGVASPVSVPVAAAGVAVVAHGATVAGTAMGNLNANSIEKPPRGKGSTPPSERDPKRVYNKKEKQEMLDDQGGNCAQCDQPKTVDEVDGHHLNRHADGGKTTKENGAAVCKDCHKKLHSKEE
ncbi:DUF6443 domain-containing protein [Ekhidna sp.]